MRKPSVNTNPVANKYTSNGERIIEFSSNVGGGLISLTEKEDGTLEIYVYRQDPNVRVTCAPIGLESRTARIDANAATDRFVNAARV